MTSDWPLLQAWLQPDFWEQAWLFLSLVLGSLGLALLVGIPLGIVLTGLRRVAGPVIAVLGLIQTFPSLALLGLLIPFIGIGDPAAIVLAFVYSLFPIVLNTYIGITQVPQAVRDAARGMGMTPRQILWHVDLPLGLPVVLAGVRTGAIYATSIVTIAALAGANGLGGYIYRGLNRGDDVLIGVGAIPVLLITMLLLWGLSGIAWLAKRSNQLGLIGGGALIVVLALHGSWTFAQHLLPQSSIRLASRNFTEGEILTEIVKQMLETHTNLKVVVVANVGPSVSLKAIIDGKLDVYPEYTGNLLTNKLGLDLPVPADKSTITAVVRAGILEKHHLLLLEPFGLNNTFVLCAPRPFARAHGLKRISDLKRVPNARVVVDLDFLDRPDGWKGLVKTYGLELPPPQLISADLRYRALGNGADIVLGFATDWEIDAYDLVPLQDDRGYFPSYHGCPLAREAVVQRHPEVAEVLNRLANRIDDRTMRRLNGEVAQKHRSHVDVAREFLEQQGLLAK